MPILDFLTPRPLTSETQPTSSGEFMARSGNYGKNLDLAFDSLSEKIAGADAPTAQAVSVHSSKPKFDYLDADLAKAYGMDASTAYQEALSNTSYQRAVADLQAAGLNPVLAAGKVAGAGGVYSADVNGSPSMGVSSANGTHDKWKQLSNIGAIIGGGSGLLIGKNLRSAYFGAKVGSSVLGAVGNLVDAT